MTIYSFTAIDDPQSAGRGTRVEGINNSGQLVGFYNGAFTVSAFFYSGTAYSDLIFVTPSNGRTIGLNDTDQIVGTQTLFLPGPPSPVLHGILFTSPDNGGGILGGGSFLAFYQSPTPGTPINKFGPTCRDTPFASSTHGSPVRRGADNQIV